MATKKPRKFSHKKEEEIKTPADQKASAATAPVVEKRESHEQTTSTTPRNPESEPTAKNFYPHLHISFNDNPNRFYAIIIFGGLIKIIMLIPVALWLFVLGVYSVFLAIYNSFRVLFLGNYSLYTYTFVLGLMNLSARTMFFWSGLTDTYPGFSLLDTTHVMIDRPENPNRFFAIPIIGGLIRILLIIPFDIYDRVISNASGIGVVVSSFPVLFAGKYPESTWTLARDSYRLILATTSYLFGLADNYPSFWISTRHRVILTILILLSLFNIIFSNAPSRTTRQQSTRSMYTAPTAVPANPYNY